MGNGATASRPYTERVVIAHGDTWYALAHCDRSSYDTADCAACTCAVPAWLLDFCRYMANYRGGLVKVPVSGRDALIRDLLSCLKEAVDSIEAVSRRIGVVKTLQRQPDYRRWTETIRRAERFPFGEGKA